MGRRACWRRYCHINSCLHSQMEARTQESLDSRNQFENHLAHLESYTPSNWMPPKLPPLRKVTLAEWRDSFTDLIYRLHDLLHEDTMEIEPGDYEHARLIFQLAREVRSNHDCTFWGTS
jgi:hypothetical protein